MDISKLIEDCLSKDNKAWAVFVEKFTGLIFYSVQNRLKAQNFSFASEDVADIVQTIFLEIWKRELLAQIKDRQKINAWLSILSQNRAVDFMRKKRERLLEEDELKSFDKLLSESQDPIEDLQKEEDWENLQEAISSLTDREKLILELFVIYEKTHREIAEFMKLPVNTVSTIIRRTKEKIKNFWKG